MGCIAVSRWNLQYYGILWKSTPTLEHYGNAKSNSRLIPIRQPDGTGAARSKLVQLDKSQI
jgi:hypothetical protein